MSSSVIGSGVIEVSADSRKLTAGIDEAKKSLKSLGIAAGDATKGQSRSIDAYIKSLGVMAVTTGKTGRELELYKLALRGATAEQLKAADSALRMTEAYAKGESIGKYMRASALALAAAGVAAAGALGAMVVSSINAADNLNDLSKKTGVSVEDLSGLSLAAKQSGTDLEGLAGSITKLSQNIGKDPERFRALGISAKDPIEAFKQLADIFSALDDPQTQAALGAAALGKSWQSAAPVLSEGSRSIGEMIEKGKKLSGVTQQLASDADAFNDNLEILKATAGGAAMKISGEMIPALTDVSKAILLAYEESGKLSALWVGMGSIGAFLFTDEFSSNTVKLKALNKELEEVRKNQDSIAGSSSLAKFMYGSDSLNAKEKELLAKKAAIEAAMAPKVAAPAPKTEADKKLTSGVNAFIGSPAMKEAQDQAKAKLSLDLENIRISSESTTRAYSNGAKIMEALRSAGLIDEQEYYASKLDFLKLNGAAEEQALADQIRRLESEKLIGAAKIENDKKIAETRAKLAAAKAGNATGVSVLGIQGDAASSKRNQEVEDFFRKAEQDSKDRSISGVEKIRQSLLTELQVETEMHDVRMKMLADRNAARLEGESSVNDQIEMEKQRHLDAVSDMQARNDMDAISMTASTSDQIYSLLVKAGKEKTGLGKAMFLATKALAVAEILINTERGAAAALGLGPFGIPMSTYIRATGYASAGIVAGTAIAEASAKDGYDIPEGQNPVVQTHAKEMILPRAQANVIRDLAKDGGDKKTNSSITIVNNTSAKIAKVTEQTLSNGERALIIEEAVAATAAQFGDPNSKTSRALSRNYSTQRSR